MVLTSLSWAPAHTPPMDPGPHLSSVPGAFTPSLYCRNAGLQTVTAMPVLGRGPCWFGPQPVGWLPGLGPTSSPHSYLMGWALGWPPVATLRPVLLAVLDTTGLYPGWWGWMCYCGWLWDHHILGNSQLSLCPDCNSTLASKVRYTLTEM